MDAITITQASQNFLEMIALSRSANTARTYRNALCSFLAELSERQLDPRKVAAEKLSEDSLLWYTAALKSYSPATERLYLTAVTSFFQYLAAERIGSPNLARIQLLVHQRARRPGQRLPQFPKKIIATVLDHVKYIANLPVETDPEKLRNLRDCAFLLTLADTGLRVHEACNLRKADIDWNEAKALIIGKGDRQAVVRFSSRSIEALRRYLQARARLDGASGRPLASLPVFARHDKGAGQKIKPITTATGRNIVNQRVKEALGQKAVGMISPHSFRHYFVTTVLQASGNLKLAQELARHRNISVTQRYAHLSDDELDQGYWEIFSSEE